jgi:uncharacterized protein YwgA
MWFLTGGLLSLAGLIYKIQRDHKLDTEKSNEAMDKNHQDLMLEISKTNKSLNKQNEVLKNELNQLKIKNTDLIIEVKMLKSHLKELDEKYQKCIQRLKELK